MKLEEYFLSMDYGTTVKLVNSVIASRASGCLYPLSNEMYKMLNETVESAELAAVGSGKSPAEELHFTLCGVYPTEEEKKVNYE